MVFALFIGAPGTLMRKGLITETPTATRASMIWRK
jgi:hypothetical protein